ncbi:hypothetical protein SEVIR_7G194100v4 [Setaria viridis]|uniref:Uncharacterized protein n=1 Tax=Setaria viridis TaxID=4556 RepID=A0A4U6TRV0_SETVI|nr:hypothetical protein SEVIR_7G194100v2 [Setaria viridis]
MPTGRMLPRHPRAASGAVGKIQNVSMRGSEKEFHHVDRLPASANSLASSAAGWRPLSGCVATGSPCALMMDRPNPTMVSERGPYSYRRGSSSLWAFCLRPLVGPSFTQSARAEFGPAMCFHSSLGVPV